MKGKFGKHLAESLERSWSNSILENCSQIYVPIFRGIEEAEGSLANVADIASAFGALSHALKRTGIINVDADQYHFNTSMASKENDNRVGRMTQLPIESSSIDLALCSMALDILPNSIEEPGRANAIKEANRVLKVGGYYITILPGPSIPDDGSNLTKAFIDLGLRPIPMLSGFVLSDDKKINTYVHLMTARKEGETDLDQIIKAVPNLTLFTGEAARNKGAAQRRSGLTSRFSLLRRNGNREPLEQAIQKYVTSKKL